MNLFCTPELMIYDKKYNDQYKYYIKKCDDFPELVLDEDNFEYLIFIKFEITLI